MLVEIVLALILSRICIYQFCNRLDSLTLGNARTDTFKLVAAKIGARDLLSCIFMPVIRNRYSYTLLLFIRQYLLLFVSCLFVVQLFCFIFIWVLFWLLSKREKNNSEPERCSGISILQYIKYLRLFQHHHLESVNIIQQTPPTLS